MFGKKKVEQAQFEGELEGLLRLFPAWEVENKPQPPPALVARFNEFRRIVPDKKSSQLLSRLLCESIDNQIKAMSHLAIAMSKNPDDLLASAKESGIGKTYLARMNRAAEALVRHVATLDESDPMRKFLIDYGFYDPSGGMQPPSAGTPSTAEMGSKDGERRFLVTIGNSVRTVLAKSVLDRLQDQARAAGDPRGALTEEQMKVCAAFANRLTTREAQTPQ
jgi:hypothetical protein